MTSFPDWPERLSGFIRSRWEQKFVWGQHDCCLFACDAVFEMTGFDMAIDFRGKYDSALSATRVMKKFANGGVEQVAEKIAAKFGIKEIPLFTAQRGDVILLTSAEGNGLGIVGLHGHTVHAAGPDGLTHVPLKDCLRAWRIPKA